MSVSDMIFFVIRLVNFAFALTFVRLTEFITRKVARTAEKQKPSEAGKPAA